MQEIRILHIMSSFGGGISTFINNLAKGASNQKIVFDVVTYSQVPDHFKQTIEATGGQVYFLKNPKKTSWQSFKKSFAKAFQDNEYQVVYSHIAGYRSIVYYYLAHQLQKGKKFDFYIHGHYRYDKNPSFKNKLLQVFDTQVNRRLSRLPIGCSSLSIQELFGLKVGESSIVIPNSIEPDDFLLATEERLAAHKYWQSKFIEKSDQSLVIGQVGRLTAVKNHLLTLEIIAYSKKQDHPLQLVIAGEGEDRAFLEEEVKKKEIKDQVFFAGRISPVANLLAGIDLLIMPSFSEGFGTVAIEAQAIGIPVIASDQISKEVDLGLGLIQFLSLECEPKDWYQTMIDVYNQSLNKIPSDEDRFRRIKNKSFTNEEAAKLYRQVLDDQVSHFQIDSR
ncbi:glycosyltransferase [Facklamia sp. 7083-14-GEN3]|uniref:glycosyltransferase n=1 Tax=Facklamia sp. 7083-14-GEN3 TaxID=2973478 RepID=UPI00215C0E2E|nr:glycosyltransferase [Facklamia sp. 7083-14-GEN3]MCR8969489.1 glycosyltransferase [Facklamia sp. 7083-14-GEN3]